MVCCLQCNYSALITFESQDGRSTQQWWLTEVANKSTQQKWSIDVVNGSSPQNQSIKIVNSVVNTSAEVVNRSSQRV